MEKDKVQNDKIQSDGEISNEDLDKVAGGRFRQDTMESVSVDEDLDKVAGGRGQGGTDVAWRK